MTHTNFRTQQSKAQKSIAKLLFQGEINTDHVFPMQFVSGDEKETLDLTIDTISDFLKSHEKDFNEFDKKGEQPKEYIQALKDLGLFGLIIDEEYGGLGFSSASYARIIQELSKYDGSTALTIGAHSSIGMRGVLLFGNEDQKKRYLPKLATGELIASFCLTESEAGSDAASVKTHAVKQADGSWILNGEKIWITNGAFAGFFTVFAKTESENGKMTAFLVERLFEGVSNGQKEDKMGIRASATTTVSFKDVRVPPENVLGEEGKGFKIAMAILNNGRTGLGGGCVGSMEKSIELAREHAENRKQFGKKLIEFELIREKLQNMEIICFATESVVQMVCNLIDSKHEDFSTEAAISKVFASEALWYVGNEALQIAGGNGFMKEYQYERIVRDSRINLIFEGTNEILRMYIALSGFKDAGDYLKDVGKSVTKFFSDPIKGFGTLSGYAVRKLELATSLNIKSNPLTWVTDEFEEEKNSIVHYAKRLSIATEAILRKYGSKTIDKQIVQSRIANIVIDLTVSLAVLIRVETEKKTNKISKVQLEKHSKFSKLFIRQAKSRIDQNLKFLIRSDDDIV